jgi:anthranilate synthase component 2
MKAGRKILLLDNYDSFSYNLVHLVEKITHSKVTVFQNDKIDLDQVSEFDKILLSPGPGIPAEAGLLIPLIKAYAASKSILGVCLGHQAIAEAFGARLVNLQTVFHGVAAPIRILDRNDTLYKGLEEQVMVGRYHSWIVSDTGLPATLEIKSVDEQNNIMGLKHTQYDVQGVQFHPESILTPCGEMILRNWLND